MKIAVSLAFSLFFSLFLFQACSDGFDSKDPVDFCETVVCEPPYLLSKRDVLVIANENSQDSVELANHYMHKRYIHPDMLLKIRAPLSPIVQHIQYKAMRNEILKFLFERTATGAGQASPCSQPGEYYCELVTETIRNETGVKFLVTTKDVPLRTYIENADLGDSSHAPASVDNHLKYELLRYEALPRRFDYLDRAKAFGNGRGQRTVDPKLDGEFIIGRLDGLDLESAKALVDRALEAEISGIFGNWISTSETSFEPVDMSNSSVGEKIYHEVLDPTEDFSYQLQMLSEHRPQCIEYLESSRYDPEGRAPITCKVQLLDNHNELAGNPSSRIPKAVNSSRYMGYLNGQETLRGLENLLNFRKNDFCDVSLCSEASDPDECRTHSTDPMKEINTECVGVAPGFIGYNYQSFPVSHFGVWPTAWEHLTHAPQWKASGNGDYFLTLPKIIKEVGTPANHVAWYGPREINSDSLCFSGESIEAEPSGVCPDPQRIFLGQKIELSGPVSLDDSTELQLSFRMKIDGLVDTEELRYYLALREEGYDPVSPLTGTTAFLMDIPAGTSGWVNYNHSISMSPARFTSCHQSCGLISAFKFGFESSEFVGNIYLDDIELTLAGQSENLIQNEGFEEGFVQTAAGDNASNFLSRLNGTAFYGSLSHYSSGGTSFGNNFYTEPLYLMRGLTLGEAAWLLERKNSGVLYGDPLFQPMEIRIHPVGEAGTDDREGENVVSSYERIYFEARNGLSERTQVKFEICQSKNYNTCDRDSLWRELPVQNPLSPALTYLAVPFIDIDFTNEERGYHILRLTAEFKQAETGDLQSYSDLQLVFNDVNSAPYFLGETNFSLTPEQVFGHFIEAEDDPIGPFEFSINSADKAAMEALGFVISIGVKGDINNNGVVDVEDSNEIAYSAINEEPYNPDYDVNFDGVVGFDDATLSYSWVGHTDNSVRVFHPSAPGLAAPLELGVTATDPDGASRTQVFTYQ